jgi:hypothetical protein
MTALRYLDVGLVIASAPVVVAAGLPVIGYLFGAGAWVITRVGAAYAERRAAASGADPRTRLGVQLAAMMARVWIVVLAVVAARFAGDREDGIMAAVLVLAAFTVYLGMSLVTRQLERNVVRS